MPTSYAFFLLRFAFLLFVCLPAAPALYGQVIPREGHLTAPQSPARAKQQLTIYPGFVIPAGGSFEGELLPTAVNPPETPTLTVSANVTIRVGETTPLTASAAALVGNAIAFDGVNDYVQLAPPTAFAFEKGHTFTVEAWLRTTATGTGVIFSKMPNAGTYRGYELYLSNGRIGCYLVSTLPSSYLQEQTTAATFNDGKWHHIAWTYNGSGDAAGSRLYVDGVDQPTTITANTLAATASIVDNTVPALIGARSRVSNFSGELDEVRVWSTVRSQNELQAHAGNPVDPASAGLAGYWRLDESLDSHEANDLAGNKFKGTLFNLPRRVRATVPFTPAGPRPISWVQCDAAGNPLPGATTTTAPRLDVSPAQTAHYRASSVRHDGTEEWAVVTVTVLPALQPLPQVRDNLNYIVEHTVLKKGQTLGSLAGLTAAELAEKITYFDGLGRPVQQVSTQASPARKDLVQPIAYDAFGREGKKYLPYPHGEAADGRYKPDALTEQPGRYGALKPEGPAFAETRFEASPLDRPLEQGAPGTDWQLTDPNPRMGNANHSVKTTTRTNRADEVRAWTYDFASGTATGTGVYGYNAETGEGQLLVSEVMDEQDHLVIEYKDKEGRLVCKKVQDGGTWNANPGFATTYYVYDTFGWLRFVIPPQAVEELASVGFTVGYGNDFAKRWLFSYRYDREGRLSEKQVPGAEPVWMVYNGRDELILTQDGRQRDGYNSVTATGTLENHPAGEWSFTKYDAFGRTVMSGLFRPEPGIDTQAAMQARVESLEATTPLFEQRESTGPEGYSARAYPRPADGTLTLLSVSYYDNYDFPNASALAFQSLNGFATGHLGGQKPGQLKGKPTSTRTRLLGSPDWLQSVLYYDAYNRTIQTVSENHSRSGSQPGRDVVARNYDFSGKLLNSETRHENLEAAGAKTRIVRTRNTYDHAGRVTGSFQQVGEGTEERLADVQYNELGELDQKTLGRENLQQVDYKYNIRGWLRSINQETLTGSDPKDDLFGMKLDYNQGGLYNGNISKQSWMSRSDRVARSYAYTYDAANRLLSAGYLASLTAASPAEATEGAFSLGDMSYDKNGNIRSLTRHGLLSIDAATRKKTFGEVDRLTYQYQATGLGRGNQLLSVHDERGNYPAGDFKNGDNQEREYAYDEAGNLESDLNKGITNVLYNHLNLPVQVEFGTGRFIRYQYDAAGVKRSKVSQDGTGNPEKVTDYIGGMVYEGDVLQFIPTAEGRALPPEQTGEHFFAYEYHYKDHLGNLRAAFRKAPAVPLFTATMEPASAPLEEAQFDNVSKTRSSERALNSTLNGVGHSAKVHAQQVLGPWRTIAVKQGDRVQAQVYAYYESVTQPNGTRASLTAFLGNPANVSSPGEQTSNLWDKLKIGLSFPLAKAVNEENNTLPVAYLKYIVYDKEYKPIKDDYIAITSQAAATNGGWEPRSFDITIAEEGYVQVLVANESEKAVWFDDLQIKHTPALIVQENHYDPWGLNLAGIEKEGNPDHKWKFLSREQQEELSLGWVDLQARMYDPQLGRFHAIDPLVELYQEAWTPYHYSFNNPVLLSDPDGRWPDLPSRAALSEIAHTALDVAGLVPGLGEVADGANAVLYLAEGNKTDAALSAAAMIPFAGAAVTGAKFIRKAEKMVAAVDATKAVAKKLPCGCFTEKTLVLTDKGRRKIKDVKEGDKVWAFEEKTGKLALKLVTHTFTFERDTVYNIHIGQEVIEATSDHPFFIGGQWLKVHQLRKGQQVSLYSGQKAGIDSIVVIAKRATVYNFTVQDFHTYYVGSKDVLVHNSGPCGLDAASSLPKLKGRTVPHTQKILKKNDFAKVKDNGKNQTWKHLDGSEVRVHKYGNQNTVPYKSGNNAHVHKENPAGDQLNDKGEVSTDASETHIGIKNPADLPIVRGRPHGTGTM
jgi:RHS repeat-associated protein